VSLQLEVFCAAADHQWAVLTASLWPFIFREAAHCQRDLNNVSISLWICVAASRLRWGPGRMRSSLVLVAIAALCCLRASTAVQVQHTYPQKLAKIIMKQVVAINKSRWLEQFNRHGHVSPVCVVCPQVTCDSLVKLRNSNSKLKIYLHSHEVAYGSGSGQQSVTGAPQRIMLQACRLHQH
jgi:hypothetical protein